VIDVGIEPEAVNTVIPIKRISVVDATESILPVKPTEAVDSEPVTAEMDATESMESTEVASSEVATMTTTEVAPAKMTTAAMATAGIRDLRQCNHARDKHRGHERDKLHDTLLLDGDLLVVTEVLGKWRSCGFSSCIYRSAHQHRVRGTMVSPVSRCSITCQSLHSRTMRRCGSISMRNGGRRRCGRGVSSCAAAKLEKPAAARANTAKPVIDRRMTVPRFG
jgi:hypothetical protein